ncbi:MAG: hypothetical protein ABIA93_01665 [Candidatus Woesearchaeota archaeon]
MRYLLFGLVGLLVLAVACTETIPNTGVCIQDAKVCSDGSYVGRVAPDCNFAPCPESNVTGCPEDAKVCADGSTVSRIPPGCEFPACPAAACDYDGPIKDYLTQEPNCVVNFLCAQGQEGFSDSCGCGCRDLSASPPSPPSGDLRYIGNSPEECSRIRFTCAVGEPFFDDKGCGCTGGVYPEENGTACNTEQRDVGACYEIYQPVCGWFNQSIQCIRYPCASTYSNDCFACQDGKVEYYTPGECPS